MVRQCPRVMQARVEGVSGRSGPPCAWWVAHLGEGSGGHEGVDAEVGEARAM